MVNADNSGFSVGVLRIEWDPDGPLHGIPCRPGRVYPAQIAEIGITRESVPRDMVNAALHGVMVRVPDGTLGVIRGVESFATMHLSPAIGRIGILVVPVDERLTHLPQLEER